MSRQSDLYPKAGTALLNQTELVELQKKATWCVLELEIILHYATRCTDFLDGDFRAPAVSAALYRLEIQGYLDRNLLRQNKEPKFKATAKLHAFVGMLKKTPAPIQEWSDPRV